jgi:hypothetical protein
MAPILRIEEKEGYLHATVTGENVPEGIFTYLMQIRDECARHSCPAVLIEEHLTGPDLDLRSIFDVVSLSSAHADPTVKRIAFVDMNPEHDPIKLEFAGNVAVGLGIDMRVFRTVPEARQWLLSQAKPSAPPEPPQTDSA